MKYKLTVKRYLLTLALLSVLVVFGIGAMAFTSTSDGYNTIVPGHAAQALTSQTVTANATPAYITTTNTPNAWDINSITGSGVVEPDPIYYSNPLGDDTAPSATVVDGECYFTADTTGSTVNASITLNWGDFSGGDANMTNSGTGANAATEYGAYGWYSGMTYASKVITKSAASDPIKASHAAGSIRGGR